MTVIGEHKLTGAKYQLIESGYDEQGEKYHIVSPEGRPANKGFAISADLIKILSITLPKERQSTVSGNGTKSDPSPLSRKKIVNLRKSEGFE
jgi:hypothetical protein